MSLNKEEKVAFNVVQEIAKAAADGLPPSAYMVREEDRPNVVDPPMVASDIPVIDLSHLMFQWDRDEAEKLRSALSSWGLFQAVGHGMPASFLDEVRDVAKKFFKLPMEIKQKYGTSKQEEEQGGMRFKFEGYGNDRLAAADQILNWNDRLFLLVQPEDERKLHLWPENPSSFRDVLDEYTKGVRKVSELVLRCIAKLLGLDEDYFIQQLGDRAEVHARFNYYPSCSRPDLVLGTKSHSDGTVITILLVDDEVEGLQVLKDGVWLNVPTIPQALLINLGNIMEVMSNGIFKSPVHRVVISQEERISLAIFYLLEQEKDIEPAPGLVDEKRPRLYNKAKMKDFDVAYFSKNLLGKSTLDWLKA